MFLGGRGPTMARIFAERAGRPPTERPFLGTVTWAPPTKVWPDDTFKGFFRIVHVARRVHVNDIAAHWVYASG